MERRIEIMADARELARAGALRFASSAEGAIRGRGSFAVALAGGSTPRALYEVLAAEHGAGSASLAWERVHVFWGDERHVPPTHADSNYRMALEALLSKVAIPPANIHRIRGEEAQADAAARAYERELREHFALRAGALPRFDLVLLGMGADGHTASLFPASPALEPSTALVAAPWVEKFSTQRVTLTPAVLNHAAQVVFFVSGSDKAETLRAVLEGEYQPQRYPSQIVRPETGTLTWLVDVPAARLLRES